MVKSMADRLRLQIKGCESLLVCTLSGESKLKVGKVDFAIEARDNSEGRRVCIHDVKVVNKLNWGKANIKDLSRWLHLQGIKIPEVDFNQVTILLGTNVPEVQVHEESLVGKPGEPYEVRTVLGWSILGPVGENAAKQQGKITVNFLRYGDRILELWCSTT